MTGAQVRDFRKRLGLSQAAFGEWLYLKQSTVSEIETARIPLTPRNLYLLEQIAQVKRVPLIKKARRAHDAKRNRPRRKG